MIGITYQVLNRLFVHVGLLNDWPPVLSATLPTLLFLTVALLGLDPPPLPVACWWCDLGLRPV